MCYTRRKNEGGVGAQRQSDDTNFLKPNGHSRNLNVYGWGSIYIVIYLVVYYQYNTSFKGPYRLDQICWHGITAAKVLTISMILTPSHREWHHAPKCKWILWVTILSSMAGWGLLIKISWYIALISVPLSVKCKIKYYHWKLVYICVLYT